MIKARLQHCVPVSVSVCVCVCTNMYTYTLYGCVTRTCLPMVMWTAQGWRPDCSIPSVCVCVCMCVYQHVHLHTVWLCDQNLFAYGDVDGTGLEARLQHPLCVCVCVCVCTNMYTYTLYGCVTRTCLPMVMWTAQGWRPDCSIPWQWLSCLQLVHFLWPTPTITR